MECEMSEERWFKTRRYGWGWGPARTWQGWVAYGTAALLLIIGVPFVRSSAGPFWATLFAGVVVAGLVAICYAKGEPPRWRWGDDER
jgi:hypothetical protein